MTRHVIVVASLSLGCGTVPEQAEEPDWGEPGAVDWGLPADRLAAPPPPYQGLRLEAPALEVGQAIEFIVRGLAPGETTTIAVSTVGAAGGPCLGILGGMCLDLQLPKKMIGGVGVADSTGVARIGIVTPAVPAGRDVWFQAVANRGVDSIKSNFQSRTTTLEVCDDGLDNDGSGLADCEDALCSAAPTCFETCDDGIDNDSDGLADCDDDECWTLACHPTGVTTTVLGGQVDVQENVESWWYAGCGLVLAMDELYETDMTGIWGQVQVDAPGGGTNTCTWEFDVGDFDFHHQSYFNLGTLVGSDAVTYGDISRAGFSISDGCNLTDSSFLPKQLSFWGRTTKVPDDPADPWGNPDWYVGGTLTSIDNSWQSTFSGACGSTMVIYHDNTFTRDPVGTGEDWTAVP